MVAGFSFKWRISDSNRSPQTCHACALPDELIPLVVILFFPFRECKNIFFPEITNILYKIFENSFHRFFQILQEQRLLQQLYYHRIGVGAGDITIIQ